MGITFREYLTMLEDNETLNPKVAMPPSECPCKKKKTKDAVIYPIPDQQTNQTFAAQTRVAGGY
jgi:hypothetical protein